MVLNINTTLGIGQIIEVSEKVGEMKPGKYIVDGISIYHEINSEITYYSKEYNEPAYDWTSTEDDIKNALQNGTLKILDVRAFRYNVHIKVKGVEKDTTVFIPENIEITKEYIKDNINPIYVGAFTFNSETDELKLVDDVEIISWERCNA